MELYLQDNDEQGNRIQHIREVFEKLIISGRFKTKQ